MFEVKVIFPFNDDFEFHDQSLRQVVGPSSYSGAGMGLRDHGFWRFKFDEALELKKEIEKEFPSWNVTMREK